MCEKNMMFKKAGGGLGGGRSASPPWRSDSDRLEARFGGAQHYEENAKCFLICNSAENTKPMREWSEYHVFTLPHSSLFSFHLPSFPPCSSFPLRSFPASFLASLLSFLPSFLPFLPSFPSFLPSFPPSFLPFFLPFFLQKETGKNPRKNRKKT